jgi:hypothetical protein
VFCCMTFQIPLCIVYSTKAVGHVTSCFCLLLHLNWIWKSSFLYFIHNILPATGVTLHSHMFYRLCSDGEWWAGLSCVFCMSLWPIQQYSIISAEIRIYGKLWLSVMFEMSIYWGNNVQHSSVCRCFSMKLLEFPTNLVFLIVLGGGGGSC